MKDKMILKDGSEIELEAGASINALQVRTVNPPAMAEIWSKLTEENLKEVQIQTGEGLIVGNYMDLLLVSETSVILENGVVLTTYHLREKTAVEKRLEALEVSQEVQDGAISDLGSATSALAEQMGGEQ